MASVCFRASRLVAVECTSGLLRFVSQPALASRGVATYVITPPKDAVVSEFLGQDPGQASLRSSTARVAGRLYGQESYPLECGTPTTFEDAMDESDQARIITEAFPPYKIVHANRAWEQLCGFKESEVVGHPGLSFMQGPGTQQHTVENINAAVKGASRIRVTVLNYKKDGSAFFNRLQVSPLRSNMGDITHMLGILSEVSPSY